MFEGNDDTLNEREIKLKVIDNADKIAKIVHKGNDIEIRREVSGIKIIEIIKKKV